MRIRNVTKHSTWCDQMSNLKLSWTDVNYTILPPYLFFYKNLISNRVLTRCISLLILFAWAYSSCKEHNHKTITIWKILSPQWDLNQRNAAYEMDALNPRDLTKVDQRDFPIAICIYLYHVVDVANYIVVYCWNRFAVWPILTFVKCKVLTKCYTRQKQSTTWFR